MSNRIESGPANRALPRPPTEACPSLKSHRNRLSRCPDGAVAEAHRAASAALTGGRFCGAGAGADLTQAAKTQR